MSEEIKIQVRLSSHGWESRRPSARVFVDNHVIHEGVIVAPTEISWSGTLESGEHRIVVEMYNKNPDDTLTDQEENIISDVLLNIDGVALDDIELERLLWTHSVYRPDAQNAPTELTDCVNLGWNGLWELTFSSPVYLWLLENL